MKKVAMLTVLALVACIGMSVVLAGDPHAKKNTHDMTVEFVSYDAKTHMIMFKDDMGAQKSAPVMGAAMKEMTNFKAGDKVTLSCLDNDKGEHQGVTMVKSAMAKK